MRVCHLTSAHPRDDVRIMHKQCRSLANAGFDVVLVVADGKGDEKIDQVKILDTGQAGSRSSRMIKGAKNVASKGAELSADLYHIHDPELIPWGLWLRRKGHRVVFDAHEELPAQIRTKHYLPAGVRGPLAHGIAIGEGLAFPRFSGLVGATPRITEILAKRNDHVALVANYPLADEFHSADHRSKQDYVLFVGSISRIRGLAQLVEAMALVKNEIRLHLVGRAAPDGIESLIEQSPGRAFTEVLGPIPRSAVATQMRHALCGIVTFLDAPNHRSSQPNKLFEYMSAGIPVIASNFDYWRTLIEGEGCGICVDPANPIEISGAIDYLAQNKVIAAQMGERGRRAIIKRLNWATQADVLTNFYKELGVVP